MSLPFPAKKGVVRIKVAAVIKIMKIKKSSVEDISPILKKGHSFDSEDIGMIVVILYILYE